MCGISVIISSTGVSIEDVHSMTNVISHRGPDDEGYVVFNSVNARRFFGSKSAKASISHHGLKDVRKALGERGQILFGHTRLAIRDLSHLGHQPMTTDDGRWWIVYNGEAYNSDELKAELVLLGHSFHSQTDTEVILRGYAEWGAGVLSKINGMFALVIYDAIEHELFIARDRYGVKPLYYWNGNGSLYLFSEIKQLTAIREYQATLNHTRAYDFLNWGQMDHTNETLYKDVHQVPAGHFAKIRCGKPLGENQFHQWYNINQTLFTGDYSEAKQIFKELFLSSVKLRMIGDVDVGSSLSGGLDSSSIVCAINNLLSEDQAQKTFSATSQIEKYDEKEYIANVLSSTEHIRAYSFELEHDAFLSNLSQLIYTQDEPFLSPSVFSEYKVFQLANTNGVKVTLDGHGADEQLAGYHTFFAPLLRSLFIKGDFKNLKKEMGALRNQHGYGLEFALRKILRGVLSSHAEQFLFRMTGRNSTNSKWIDANVLDCDFNSSALPDESSIRALSVDQLLSKSLPKQLHWCDRDSMAHSVESRAPYLDHRLVDFIASLPDHFKIEKGTTKRIQRDALSSVLPRKIRLRRDKMGFVTPGEHWVTSNPEKYSNWVKELNRKSNGILTSDCERLLLDMIYQRRSFDHTFWRALFFSEWMSSFGIET